MRKLVSVDITQEEDAAIKAGVDALNAVRERFKEANDGIALFINVIPRFMEGTIFHVRTGMTGWWTSPRLSSAISNTVSEKNGNWKRLEADRLRRCAAELEADAAELDKDA